MATSSNTLGSELVQIGMSSEEAMPPHPSPPTPPPSNRQNGGLTTKPKRPPAVTPRSFTRFFTPRSSQESPQVSTSREALQTITRSAINRSETANDQSLTFAGPLGEPLGFEDGSENLPYPPRKRRRLSHFNSVRTCIQEDSDAIQACSTEKNLPYFPNIMPTTYPLPMRRSKLLGSSGSMLSRSIGGIVSARTMSGYDIVQSSREQTSNFYSRPQDAHYCDSLPFCATSCNTNSLVAIGDEEGNVRLLESANGDGHGLSKAWLVFKPHANAILDLYFSSDDKLLATASGDQTALVVDMPTQTSICTLSRHASSVKQVRFQPGSGDSIIATSSRDGNVNIWDLRCQTRGQPVLQATTQFEPDRAQEVGPPPNAMRWASITNQIRGGHTGGSSTPQGRQPRKASVPSAGTASKPDSVTSLEFLRQQIFVTASESNACVKVWDMRVSYSQRRGQPVPVSTTREPESHQNYRQFGLTSMTLSSDKTRLYTVCRDNTIYAYSTSHLILGTAPELNPDQLRARRYGDMDNEGLGPIFGLRHPRFHVATFYVKSSLRKGADDNTELLAVGSSDNCAILFPTDEKQLRQKSPRDHLDESQAEAPFYKPLARPSLARSSSGLKVSTRLADTIPIYASSGTCLTEGHQKEVGGVAWTQSGSLITVGDDFRARCWREGSDARALRKGGESGGARWNCGWAEADEESDVEEA